MPLEIRLEFSGPFRCVSNTRCKHRGSTKSSRQAGLRADGEGGVGCALRQLPGAAATREPRPGGVKQQKRAPSQTRSPEVLGQGPACPARAPRLAGPRGSSPPPSQPVTFISPLSVEKLLCKYAPDLSILGNRSLFFFSSFFFFFSVPVEDDYVERCGPGAGEQASGCSGEEEEY